MKDIQEEYVKMKGHGRSETVCFEEGVKRTWIDYTVPSIGPSDGKIINAKATEWLEIMTL
jgi:hypothetical protein